MKIKLEIDGRYWRAARGNRVVIFGPVATEPLHRVWDRALYWFLAPRFDGQEYARLCRRGEKWRIAI